MGVHNSIGPGYISSSARETAIVGNKAAPEQGLIFTDGHLYILTAPSILANIIQVLLHVGPWCTKLLMIGSRPPTMVHKNDAPMGILPGHGTMSTIIMIFINNNMGFNNSYMYDRVGYLLGHIRRDTIRT